MELLPVHADDRELLWNINQKYLYEMTNYYADEMDAQGILHYGYFDAYFTDPKRRAFFLREDSQLVGFAMIHPYSNLGRNPDYVLAEFTIFPMYRGNHLASTAAELIFERFPGSWEVKYNEANIAAKTLWISVTTPYQPEFIPLSKEETVLTFSTAR